MAIEAKRAAKLEKKLKTLLGGYQVKYSKKQIIIDLNLDLRLVDKH